MTKIFCIALFIVIFHPGNTCSSQETTQEKPKRLKGLSILTFSGSQRTSVLSMIQFNTLAPQSQLLKTDFTNFEECNQNVAHVKYRGGSADLHINSKGWLSFRQNVFLRLGLGYYSSYVFDKDFDYEDRNILDTVFINNNGFPVTLDSVSNINYDAFYIAKQLRLDAAIIYRMFSKRHWALTAGFACAAGISVQSRTAIHYRSYIRKEIEYAVPLDPQSDQIFEKHKNRINYSLATYLPVELSYRLGKKSIGKRLQVYVEVRNGFNFLHIPELNHWENRYQFSYGPGIRYSFG